MSSKDAKTFDEYAMQKLGAEFGDYVMTSSQIVLDPENIKACMKVLAKSIGEFISKQGYKPSEKSEIILKIPFSEATADPTNQHGSLGGKVDCKLTATKDQYVLYASEVIEELKEECKEQIEKTWKERLIEHLTTLFDEKYPWIDRVDIELEDEFLEKRDRLIVEIEKLVEGFEIP